MSAQLGTEIESAQILLLALHSSTWSILSSGGLGLLVTVEKEQTQDRF